MVGNWPDKARHRSAAHRKAEPPASKPHLQDSTPTTQRLSRPGTRDSRSNTSAKLTQESDGRIEAPNREAGQTPAPGTLTEHRPKAPDQTYSNTPEEPRRAAAHEPPAGEPNTMGTSARAHESAKEV